MSPLGWGKGIRWHNNISDLVTAPVFIKSNIFFQNAETEARDVTRLFKATEPARVRCETRRWELWLEIQFLFTSVLTIQFNFEMMPTSNCIFSGNDSSVPIGQQFEMYQSK